ncbi:hypothetical protein [Caldanaerobacter subterraneus]|uniref:hypothetical protein n=1 Tax=Caldanaerobacter subterraneus TaxID=911092 RepID=UPI0034644C24
MRKIIALVIVIALAVAGYQVYMDANKRITLEEKVKGVLYSIGDSVYVNDSTGVSSSEKVRVDLQPYADKFVEEYPCKNIELVLQDGIKINILFKKAFIAEVIQDTPLNKKGDLVFYIQQQNIVIPKSAVNVSVLDKYSNETCNFDDIFLVDNKIKLKNRNFPKNGNSFNDYLVTAGTRGILTVILSDELAKYVSTNSPIYLHVVNSPLLPYSAYSDNYIKVSTDKIFGNKAVYVKSYFQYKDGKFYEIKRESNVKEYVEWAKKNL